MNNNYISYLNDTLKKFPKARKCKQASVKSLFGKALKTLGTAAVGSGATYAYLNKDKIKNDFNEFFNKSNDLYNDVSKGINAGLLWNKIKQEKVVGAGIGAALGASLNKIVDKKSSGLLGAILGGATGLVSQHYLNNGGLSAVKSDLSNFINMK